MMFWMKEENETLTVDLKLHQLLQTSPELLFYQKIEAHEFGEALLLAERFNLDKNEVYKAQWNVNKSYTSAVYVRYLPIIYYCSNYAMLFIKPF